MGEHHIYGSSRLAINRPASPLEWSYTFVVCGGDISNCRTLFTPLVLPLVNYSVTQRHLGYKEFELNNHLGNVIATVSDRKLPLKLCANYFNTFNERILDGIIPDNALVEIENNQLKVQPLQANGGVNITYPTSPQVNYVVSFDINLGTITPDDGLKAVFYGYNRSTNQYGPVTHTIAIDRNGTFTYTYTGQPQTDGYTKLYFSTGANTGNTLTPHYFYVDNFVVASTAAIEDGGTIGLDPCGPAFAVFNGYFPDLLMHTDYYAFGMEMPGRSWTSSDYRYGFNGKEQDNETFKGASDFGLREYDERIGRFFSKDPFSCFLFNKTPYCFAGNSPITFVDQNGGFQISKRNQRKYPQLNRVLKTLSNIANEDPTLSNPIINSIIRAAGLPLDNNSLEEVLQMLSYGSGPVVLVQDIEDFGNYTDGDNFIKLRKGTIRTLEANPKNLNVSSNRPRNNDWIGQASYIGAFLTIIHEGTHYIDWESDGNSSYNAFLTSYSRARGLGYDIGDYATGRIAGVGVRGYVRRGGLMEPYADGRWFQITTIRDMFDQNRPTNIPGLSNLNYRTYSNWLSQYGNGSLINRNVRGNGSTFGFNYVNTTGMSVQNSMKAINAGKYIIQGLRSLFNSKRDKPAKLRAKF